MEKLCKWCGKEFVTHKNNQKYCSPECSKKSLRNIQAEWAREQRKPMIKNCKLCGKPFKISASSSVYCSKECAAAMNRYNCALYGYRHGLSKTKPELYDYMPDGVYFYPIRQRKSLERKETIRRTRKKICPICNEIFDALGKQKYCCEKCKKLAQRYSISKSMYLSGVAKTEPVFADYQKGGRLYERHKSV